MIYRLCSKFMLGRFSLRISAGTSAFLTKYFRDFPHSLRATAEIVPRLGLHRFLRNPFHFIIQQTSYIPSSTVQTLMAPLKSCKQKLKSTKNYKLECEG